MTLLEEYIEKVKQQIEALKELERLYLTKTKGKVYVERKTYHQRSLEHWSNKLNKVGKESNILEIQFDLPKEHDKIMIDIFKRYETQLIGVNEEMAKQIIRLKHPLANNFSFKEIEPGNLKEI